MAGQQGQGQDKVIYVDGLGFVPVLSGQTDEQATAIMQAKRGAGISKGGINVAGAGRSAGLNLPDPNALSPEARTTLGTQFQSLLNAAPQLAGAAAQMYPPTRALGTVADFGIPAITQMIVEAGHGQMPDWEVPWEGAKGAAFGMLGSKLGAAAMNKGRDMVKKGIFSTVDPQEMGRAAESALPDLALQRRAGASMEGVNRMGREADDLRMGTKTYDAHGNVTASTPSVAELQARAKGLKPTDPKVIAAEGAAHEADNMDVLTALLERTRKQASMGKSGSSMTSVLPGSGAATTVARAAQLPAAAAQLASPIVAAAKGNPARRIAVGRNLVRPANLADSSTIGDTVSQILRALDALHEFKPPARRQP